MDPLALMDFLGFRIGEVERMMLVMIRISGLFLTAPFFSRTAGPSRSKAMLIILLTFVIYPLVGPWNHEGEGNLRFLFQAALTELAIGAIIGMMIHWILFATQVAGSLMGFQMGLSMAMVMDPTSGLQEGVLSNLLYLTGLMLFLSLDGHHLILDGFVRSFHALPLGHALPAANTLLDGALHALLGMFQLALLLAAPIVAFTKMLYLGMGLINKASPQIQVFFLSMPVAQIVGLMVLGLYLTLAGEVLMKAMNQAIATTFLLMR
ncbi:flagellar biosynthetic protein FliR [Candidatus Magnetaquicoccus inordinatus]|uniref:flagellar biosynthetic protein FliR n=1 Tax=Candidatus Magnetaquicoccus inordinatus TaxID=2496818 RepID=UPI00102CBA50|nr:flagellar biosynthetic protein FliR [Candidatus Magnetaquicoccus inordinatus]